MSENTNNSKFTAYEYKDITVRCGDTEAIYTDSYGSFGWKLEGTGSAHTPASVTMKFKRDRKIPNKVEITKLQREFENHAKEIERLERSKVTVPSAVAYTIGLVGTGFMAGATFSYLATMIPLCIILAVPGFACWAMSYFAYQRVQAKKSEKVAPLIDREYDTIYAICEKAGTLLPA